MTFLLLRKPQIFINNLILINTHFMKYPAALIFSFLSLISFSQNNLDAIEGIWKGNGNLFGKEAQFEMTWEKTLNDKFFKLSFSNEFTDNKGAIRSLKSQAFYKIIDNKEFEGYWFDSRGLILPLKASFTDSELTVFWGDDTTEKGKTVYTINDDKTIDVTDYVSIKGDYKLFGSANYVKVELN